MKVDRRLLSDEEMKRGEEGVGLLQEPRADGLIIINFLDDIGQQLGH